MPYIIAVHDVENRLMSLSCAIFCFWKYVNCRLGIPSFDRRLERTELLIDVVCGQMLPWCQEAPARSEENVVNTSPCPAGLVV